MFISLCKLLIYSYISIFFTKFLMETFKKSLFNCINKNYMKYVSEKFIENLLKKIFVLFFFFFRHIILKFQ